MPHVPFLLKLCTSSLPETWIFIRLDDERRSAHARKCQQPFKLFPYIYKRPTPLLRPIREPRFLVFSQAEE